MAALLTAAGGIGSGVAVARNRRTLSAGATPLLDPNIALNRQPLIMAHNVGSQQGQGSIPLLASSQTLTLSRILGETPVRGLELDLWSHRGEVVVNHGGRFSKGIARGKLELHLAKLKAWLDRPQNKDEFVVLMIENHLNHKGIARVAQMLDETFGERIFTPGDRASGGAQPAQTPPDGDWPTPRELTLRGKQVMVITDSRPLSVAKPLNASRLNNLGSISGGLRFPLEATIRDLSFAKRVVNAAYGRPDTWEDRTAVGRLGPITPQWDWHPKLDTTRVRQLSEAPGIIKLDQVNARDARLLRPDQRAAPGSPDMSLAALVYLETPGARGAAFGAGAGLSVGAFAFGLVASLLRLKPHGAVIGNAEHELREGLESLSLNDVMALRAPSDLTQPISADEVGRAVIKTNQRRIDRRILAACGHTTLTTSGALAMGSVLLPSMLSSLSLLSLSILGLGAVFTAVAMIAGRARLAHVHREGLGSDQSRSEFATRAHALETVRSSDSVAASRPRQVPAGLKHLERAGRSMVWAGLVSRISASDKYPLPAVAQAAWISSGAALFLAGLLDAAVAQRRRQQSRANAPQLLADTLFEALESPRFGRVFSQQFDRTVATRREQLTSDLGLPADASLDVIRRQLSQPGHQSRLEALQADALLEVIAHEAGAKARGEVLRNGATGSLKAVAVFWNAAAVLPQAGYLLLGAATVALLGGGSITAGMALLEGYLTRRAAKAAGEAHPALRRVLVDQLEQSRHARGARIGPDTERADPDPSAA